MAPSSQSILKQETDFLSGVESTFEAAKGRLFRGSSWQRSEADDEDRLRALMAANRNYDKELLKSLPCNRRVAVHGYERRWLWGKRRIGVAIASVLVPLEHYASGTLGNPPAIGLAELMEHLRRLTPDRKIAHVIGVFCPTGLTAEARGARLDLPNVSVVLVEPDGRGGWERRAAGESVDPRLLELFDPESDRQKVDRVRQWIDEQSVDLLTGGLAASNVAQRAGVAYPVVRKAFSQIAAADPELRVSNRDGDALLFRGAPVFRQEKVSMNVIDRIRQLFSSNGDMGEKINLLSERRATLAQRRDRMYDDIAKLETKEADLLAQGKAATSAVPRKRLAAQLALLRKDILRQNTTAAMLNKQIDIITTDIHNLTLIQQGKTASLPDSEELTEHAVEAEEMLETLKADADLVGSLGTGLEGTLVSADELAILKEFEQADEPQRPAAATPEPRRVAEQQGLAADREQPEAPLPPPASKRRASKDAEPT